MISARDILRDSNRFPSVGACTISFWNSFHERITASGEERRGRKRGKKGTMFSLHSAARSRRTENLSLSCTRARMTEKAMSLPSVLYRPDLFSPLVTSTMLCNPPSLFCRRGCPSYNVITKIIRYFSALIAKDWMFNDWLLYIYSDFFQVI